MWLQCKRLHLLLLPAHLAYFNNKTDCLRNTGQQPKTLWAYVTADLNPTASMPSVDAFWGQTERQRVCVRPLLIAAPSLCAVCKCVSEDQWTKLQS